MNKIDPTKITVREGLDRFRQDMGEIKELSESIKKYGQINPISITKDFELIAGGRRLAACIFGKIDVSYVFQEDMTDLMLREVELEENLRRKDFTPAETALAIEEIHRIKQAQEGKAIMGSPNSGWTMEDTAHMLGTTQGYISQQILIAQTVKEFPNLKECKTLSEIRQAVKGIQKNIQRKSALEKFESQFSTLNISSIWHKGDSIEWMKSLLPDSVDIIMSDPPYGINIGDIMTTAGSTGGHSLQGFKFDDTPDVSLYRNLAEQATRVCKKDTAFAVIFISTDYFNFLRGCFIRCGWDVSVRPLVWVKPGGSSNAPKVWPISSYEIAMFARRSRAYLQIEGFRDVILDIVPVNPASKKHPTEKPATLFQRLLQVISIPGQTMIDPFAGSGASLIAGIREKLIVKGCDILQECEEIFKEKLLLEGNKINCD